jgi:hypothetical protein
MPKRIVAPVVAVAVMFSAPLIRSQTRRDGWEQPVKPPVKRQKSEPAPVHDISGIWDPGLAAGIQALGAKAMPDDGTAQHRPPFTALGLEKLSQTKPSNGFRSTLAPDSNDPVIAGDPQGMPREDLFELRTVQIFQTPVAIYLLYQFGRVWRVIWTDGREVPKDAEPRWFGYSVGKWVDDHTLVVETTKLDERTWIDHAGRPHSDALRVEERFYRADHDQLELSVTIDDPKMYTKPWVALDKFAFDLQPQTFDVREMFWEPSEFQTYNKLLGDEAAGTDK